MNARNLSELLAELVKAAATGCKAAAAAGGVLEWGEGWLGGIPRVLGEAMKRAGLSGAVVYRGEEKGVHVYVLFCRDRLGRKARVRLELSVDGRRASILYALARRLTS